MKAAGKRTSGPPIGKLISLATIVLALSAAVYVEHRSARLPSTDAATIDADVVHVASAVGGRISEIPVT